MTPIKVTHERAREAARRLINSHFGNPDQARCSIPARPNEDDDLVLMAYIEQQANNRPTPIRVTNEGGWWAIEAQLDGPNTEGWLLGSPVESYPTEAAARARMEELLKQPEYEEWVG